MAYWFREPSEIGVTGDGRQKPIRCHTDDHGEYGQQYM